MKNTTPEPAPVSAGKDAKTLLYSLIAASAKKNTAPKTENVPAAASAPTAAAAAAAPAPTAGAKIAAMIKPVAGTAPAAATAAAPAPAAAATAAAPAAAATATAAAPAAATTAGAKIAAIIKPAVAAAPETAPVAAAATATAATAAAPVAATAAPAPVAPVATATATPAAETTFAPIVQKPSGVYTPIPSPFGMYCPPPDMGMPPIHAMLMTMQAHLHSLQAQLATHAARLNLMAVDDMLNKDTNTEFNRILKLVSQGSKELITNTFTKIYLCLNYVTGSSPAILVNYVVEDCNHGVVCESQQYTSDTSRVNLKVLDRPELCNFCKNGENIELAVEDGVLYVASLICGSCCAVIGGKSKCGACHKANLFVSADGNHGEVCKDCHKERAYPRMEPAQGKPKFVRI